MPKVVWYISKYFSPPLKGTGGGRDWLLLKNLSKQGIEPIAIVSDSNNLTSVPELVNSNEVIEEDGVKVVWLKTLKYSVAKSSKRILTWFHFEWNLFRFNTEQLKKPDVIIVSSLSLLTVLNGLRLSRKYKCPLVFEVRDIWPLTITEEGGVNPKHPFVLLLRYIEKLGYKKADHIVGTMPNLTEHVTKSLGYEKAVSCIPMGIDLDVISKQESVSDTYAKDYLIRDDVFKVVHAGTIGITNALEPFFEAAEAMKDNKDVCFILVGDGALKSEYKARYGHLENLVFAPKVPKTQVQSVLSYGDLLYFSVFDSEVWKYGQSLNKVIDYMLSDKPILASYSGYPSMINEANCGKFVESGSVEKLVSEIERFAKMEPNELANYTGKGRKWLIENRNYEQLSKQYTEILSNVEAS
ncbi:glycosyltransferase family 4 protein [Pseudoalteromonas sp. SMS1]|uniref:glycosyltransferase family 4 protein n=1 Tax=Pseudoalteromonas sp. SMS1 TaxID=2908894 RepID=UPI001F2DD6D6|nr:glycosyltransferase family 4 protein [Pseudoalteromonas sp. SMS1]MCF2857403.1 glycosyltransferase family 4 protein [Pseudoalteromonas sp. SMS1]